MHPHTSRIITNLILPELDRFLLFQPHPVIAVSPISLDSASADTDNSSFRMRLRSAGREWLLKVYSEKLNVGDLLRLKEHLMANKYQTETTLNILFNGTFTLEPPSRDEENGEQAFPGERYRIDVSISNGNREFFLSLILPLSFFRLFTRNLLPGSAPELIEHGIIDFFRNPLHLFPSLQGIFESFNDHELQMLLYQLQKKRLLTPYQLCLIIMSLPHHSLRIKKNLSRNNIKDVREMMTRMRLSVVPGRRDLAGGIYSIEETIFFLMKNGEDFSYSRFFRETQGIVQILSRTELLLSKDFTRWMEEMRESGLLNRAVSMTGEKDLYKAFSADPEACREILVNSISTRKREQIMSLLKEAKISPMDRMKAQAEFVSLYRRLRAGRPGHEQYERLLSHFTHPDDYNHLLFSTGWFVLSTALKGAKRLTVKRLLDRVPLPARYLIEDVLRGVINPGIIHDEMQVNRARALCVRNIASLAEDGIITLEGLSRL